MKNFVIKVLTLLEKEKSKLPFGLDEEIFIENFSETGISSSSKFVEKPDFTIFVFKLWNKIKELQEYKDCIKCMNKDEIIKEHLNKLVGTYEQKGRVDIDRILQTLILGIVYHQNNFKFEENIFLQHFKKIEEFFIHPKIKFYASAPLEGFISGVNKIQLDKNLRIIRISKEDLIKLLKLGRYGLPVPQNRIFHFRFLLEMTYETDKIIGEKKEKPAVLPSQEVKQVFNKVVSALRLFKAGTVGYNFIQTKSLSWTPIGGTSTTSGIFTYPYFGQYKLEEHEIEEFKSLFKKIKKAPKFLTIPLSRFNFAYDREKPEDKLIDYVTALESLLVKEMQELSYRLSLRASLLLGNNSKKREEIYNMVKKAYTLRSKIVHE